MKVTNIRYTFKSATKYGLAPDEKCDCCLGSFTQEPIKDQNRAGGYYIYCSEWCAKKGPVVKLKISQMQNQREARTF